MGFGCMGFGCIGFGCNSPCRVCRGTALTHPLPLREEFISVPLPFPPGALSAAREERASLAAQVAHLTASVVHLEAENEGLR